jgi:hypothetical protein
MRSLLRAAGEKVDGDRAVKTAFGNFAQVSETERERKELRLARDGASPSGPLRWNSLLLLHLERVLSIRSVNERLEELRVRQHK